jgi:hypothetical protein
MFQGRSFNQPVSVNHLRNPMNPLTHLEQRSFRMTLQKRGLRFKLTIFCRPAYI